jgi:hypothetical protein
MADGIKAHSIYPTMNHVRVIIGYDPDAHRKTFATRLSQPRLEPNRGGCELGEQYLGRRCREKHVGDDDEEAVKRRVESTIKSLVALAEDLKMGGYSKTAAFIRSNARTDSFAVCTPFDESQAPIKLEALQCLNRRYLTRDEEA